MRRVAVALFSFSLWACAGSRPSPRVPLSHNFSREELLGTGLLAGVTATLAVFQDEVVSSLGPSRFPAAPRLDRVVSDALYTGTIQDPFLDQIPDYAGVYIIPAAAVAFYLTDATLFGVREHGFAGDVNADHELMALLEAYIVTMSVTQTTKVLARRERPVYELERDGADPASEGSEAMVSFFSGHTASSFCIAAFVHRDVSDWLVNGALAHASPATRVLVGRILPGAVFYGAAATVGVSRIIDQRHYLTDVLVGAAVGTLVGNLVYWTHFDAHGEPRDRFPTRVEVVPVVSGDMTGIGVAGRF